MPPSLKKIIYTSSQEAERAYYEAIAQGNLEALMSVWAEADDMDDVVSVNPAGFRVVGHAAIRDAWRRIFSGDERFTVRYTLVKSLQLPFAAVHSVIEEIGLQGADLQPASVLTTNVYVRGPLGWRMVANHSSPANPNLDQDQPKVLH